MTVGAAPCPVAAQLRSLNRVDALLHSLAEHKGEQAVGGGDLRRPQRWSGRHRAIREALYLAPVSRYMRAYFFAGGER
jgi:hypothetical protein